MGNNSYATGGESLRADAARNRTRVASAAREAFAELGAEAPMIEIARRAGVGTATLYRRFPTRDDLFELVFEDRIESCARTAESFLDHSATDPGEAFAGYLRTLFDLQREDRAFTVALLHTFPEGGRLEQERQHAMLVLNRLIEAARSAGALRNDFTINDMELLLKAHDGVLCREEPGAEAASLRIIELLLDSCLPSRHTSPEFTRAAIHPSE